jgi:predicted small metal-binding protein
MRPALKPRFVLAYPFCRSCILRARLETGREEYLSHLFFSKSVSLVARANGGSEASDGGRDSPRSELGTHAASGTLKLEGNRRGQAMKPLTCKQLGGKCDHKITAAAFEDAAKAMTKHVTKKHPLAQTRCANTFLLKSSGALDTVTGFYRTHLTDMTTEHKDDQGSIFYTKAGATVTVTPGN